MNLGIIGAWTYHPYVVNTEQAIGQVKRLEELGVQTCWIPEGPGRDALTFAAILLAETERLCVATGIANVWLRDPETMVAGQRTLWDRFPQRFLLGLGISHQPIAASQGHKYEKPVTRMSQYLDSMAKTPWLGYPLSSTPPSVLAALGDKMLGLSKNKTHGAHPYLVPVEHTQHARSILGDKVLLAPEQAVIIGKDKNALVDVARAHLARYLVLPNYTNNLKNLGFTEKDFDAGGSDHLVNSLYALGSIDLVVDRVHQHLSAGADHVAVQLLDLDLMAFPEKSWGQLAPALMELKKESFKRQPNPVVDTSAWVTS